ncbi:hypothetical protein D4T97_003490 [Siminovitchia acidinfaciens]|uniref:Uncharacterized protein n=1 Tax=Siminovitchia acidinfaciens TaxID=2321395 RepID=A0A429Y800_9BACI|nr:hypothetical protein D4T97_003490 [Siminovitchia acidinfaciens]
MRHGITFSGFGILPPWQRKNGKNGQHLRLKAGIFAEEHAGKMLSLLKAGTFGRRTSGKIKGPHQHWRAVPQSK